MDVLVKKPNLLYLIFVRKCYDLKFWLRSLHRNKLLKAVTVCLVEPNKTTWHIKPHNSLIIHRENGPAIMTFLNKNVGGDQEWYKNGNRHRDDGPAIIRTNGDQIWYKDGNLHRDDGPACISANGDKWWYKDDKLHRDDGPAAIYANGGQHWYKEGNRHREDGPAIIYADGDQFWYKEGNRHREDGPAIIRNDVNEWWINDIKVDPF